MNSPRKLHHHKKNRRSKRLRISQQRKCATKQRFDTQEEARNAMNAMLWRKDHKGNTVATVLRVYRCGGCGRYHYGRVRGLINWNVVK